MIYNAILSNTYTERADYMKFDVFGNSGNPIVIMLAGSFCPAESMKELYSRLSAHYYVIVPTYNGHCENSGDFTSRRGEAAQIRSYLRGKGIERVRLIYGQSMGAEVGMELLSQLASCGATVDTAFFDGGPFIKLSSAYKALMLIKFKTLISMVRTKSIDDVLAMPLVNKFSNGDPECYRGILEDMKKTSAYLSDESVVNVNECCYTFDFPAMDESVQKRLFFFYGGAEKAYKTCFANVKKAYPMANYKVVPDSGHLTYCAKHPDEYVKLLIRCAEGRKQSV